MTDLGPGDDELIAAVARGDQPALLALYDRHGRMGYGLAYRILGDAGAAEEAVQDAYLRIWRRASTFDAPRRRALLAPDHRPSLCHRSAAAPGRRAPVVAGLDEMADRRSVPDAWSEVSGRIESERVRSAVETLPGEQRRAIEMAFFDGLTHREIAERDGLPLGTVKGRLRLGLKRLSVFWRNRRPVGPVRRSSIVEPNLTVARHAATRDLLGAFALGRSMPRSRHGASASGDVRGVPGGDSRAVARGRQPPQHDRADGASPALRDRIAAAIMAEAASPAPAPSASPAPEPVPTIAPAPPAPEPIRKPASFWSRATPWAAAAILLLLSAGLLVWNLRLREQIATALVAETIALAPTDAARGPRRGHLSPAGRSLHARRARSPPLEPDQVYEVWLIGEDGTGAGRRLRPADGPARDRRRPRPYDTLAITAEPGPLGTEAPPARSSRRRHLAIHTENHRHRTPLEGSADGAPPSSDPQSSWRSSRAHPRPDRRAHRRATRHGQGTRPSRPAPSPPRPCRISRRLTWDQPVRIRAA